MDFIFVNEDNTFVTLKGDLDGMVKAVKHRTKAQKHWTGFLGVIDHNNVVKASVVFRHTDKTVHTKILTFIRKYSAIAVLHQIAELRKQESTDG